MGMNQVPVNQGPDYDMGTNTHTITGDDVGIVATKLLNAIHSSVKAVNESGSTIAKITILHKKAGIGVEVTKTAGTSDTQKENLIEKVKEQLNTPAADGNVPAYNKKLGRALEIRDKQITAGGYVGRSLKSPRIERTIKPQKIAAMER